MMSSSTHAEDSKDYKENDFKEVPISVVGYLEQYEFAGTEGVHCLSAEISTPRNVER